MVLLDVNVLRKSVIVPRFEEERLVFQEEYEKYTPVDGTTIVFKYIMAL